jgi:hypothetical protein
MRSGLAWKLSRSGPEIGGQVRRVGHQLVEVVARGVVEREAGDPAELRVEVLQLLAPQVGLASEHLLLGGRQHAVEAPQDGEGEDDVLVLAALEGVADEVGDTPEEADDLAMVHPAVPGGTVARARRGRKRLRRQHLEA